MDDLSKYIGLTKGVLTVVEILRPTVNHKSTVVKCLCSKCGTYSEVRLDRLTTKVPYAEHYCKNCKDNYYLEQAKKKFIGMKHGVLECIDVSRKYDNKIKGYRTMAICKCSKCGSTTEVRTERLSPNNKYVPQSCSNCVNDIYRTTTLERYHRLYNCNGIEYKAKIHDSRRLTSIKSNAETRNLKFLLTDEQALNLLHQDCYYCGQPKADGIDRIDSNKDYTVDNCVPCCKVCNIMKNKFSSEIFFNHIKSIYEKHFSESSTTIPKGSTPQANGGGKRREP